MSLKDRIPARTSYKFLLWFLTATFMLLTAAQLFGQLETGKISGTVRDTSGAVIPDATVTVKSVATGAERSVQSGSIGQYLIPALLREFMKLRSQIRDLRPSERAWKSPLAGAQHWTRNWKSVRARLWLR